LVDLEVFYLGHLKNLYTIQYNTIHTDARDQYRLSYICVVYDSREM